jgi:AraC-like DNA-binding protein
VITHLASLADVVWRMVESYGQDPLPLFQEHGFDHDTVPHPNRRISEPAFLALWEAAEALVDDPCCGLRATQCWHPSHLHALGYGWLASTSLRTALGRLARYIKIVTSNADMAITNTEEGVSLTFSPNERRKETASLAGMEPALVTSMCRVNYGVTLDPVQVRLGHPAPACAGDYSAYYRCPVAFDTGEYSLVLPTDAVDKPLAGANPHLAELNDQVVQRYLDDLRGNEITEQVKRIIAEELPSGCVSDETVARILFMGPRTLQRRLKQRSISFRQLLQQTRRVLADRYLAEGNYSATEIAFMLGFSDISTFSRAYKQWTGVSPAAIPSQP